MKKTINFTFSKMLMILLMLSVIHGEVAAQLAVTPESSAQALIDEFLGVGVVVTNVEVNCADGGIGFFDGTASNVGIDEGIILTSGQVFNAVGPNDMSGASSSNNTPGDPDLQDIVGVNTFDACVFEFDFVPVSSTLTFNYVFASEEYLEYVDQFNDVFAFLISGPGFNGLENIALIPGTTQPVTINNVNNEDNSAFFVNNGDGIENIDPASTVQYDGFTAPLSVQVDVTPCETYHLKLAISDASDNLLDSGVFLEANSLGTDVTFEEPTVDCNSDGTYMLEFAFNGSNDGNVYTLTESDINLSVSDVTFTDDGSVTTVTMGPYPAASSWDISIEGGDFCGTTLDFAGMFDCCVGQSCEASTSVTILPCDDGSDCTINDVEVILSCNNNICTPCAGEPIGCSITACAPDMEVACTADIVADITALELENCGANAVIEAGEVTPAGTNSACGEFDGDIYAIQYTVTSECGEVTTCIQAFTIATDSLIINCPDDVAGLTCGTTLPEPETTLTGSNGCDLELTVIDVVDSELPTSFCTGNNLAVTRTYTVEDACGNQAQCVQTFSFETDTEGPEVTCPEDVTGLTCGDELPAPETVLPGIDNCSPNVEYLVGSAVDSEMPTSFCAGDNLVVTRTYTVSDECRNSVQCVQTFTFEADTEGPQVDCPADVTGLVCGDELPTAETMLSGTDNCSSATEFMVMSVVDSDFPTSFCAGEDLVVTRTYTVADECGNETECVQNFTFEADVETPQIDCPADVTGLACGDTLPPAETTLSGTDNCGSVIEFTVTAVNDSDLPSNLCESSNLSIIRSYTVVDDCGNEAQCVQTFTFEADMEGPQIDCPADVSGLACGDMLPPADSILSGTDNCSSTTEFAVISAEDSEFPTSFCTGNNLAVTRTYTVADDCGNETQCVQTFNFDTDTEGPEVTCPADVTGLTCGDELPPAETVLPGIDNCSPDVEYLVSSVVDSEMPTSFCAGDNLVVTRTYTVSDECRNTVECVQTFTFEADTEGPQVDCLADVTGLVCGDELPAAETMLSGTDNCSSATEFMVMSVEDSDFPENFCDGSNLGIIRTYTVADECGNETQCIQNFFFEADTIAPQIDCPEDVTGLSCGDELPPAETVLSGTDNCGSTVEFTVMSVEDSEFASSFCTGDNLSRTRTYTVVDDCGNEAQCVQTFTYDPDTEAPEVTCPADVTGLTCGDELPPAETVLPGIDNCSPNVEYLVSSVVDSEMPTSFCAGDNLVVTRTYTVSDECRNTVECVQTFTFEADTEGPVLDCLTDVTGLVCGDELPTAETMLSGIDNCSSATEFMVMSVVDSDLPTSFCTGEDLVVTRTYTVADDCGNETQCLQNFTFEADTEMPNIDCPEDVAGLTCGDTLPPAETTLSGTDNCGSTIEFTVTSVTDSDLPTSLCAGEDLVVTRTYTVADDCGNETECVQAFTFEADTEGPQIDCPADVTGLSCGDELPSAETTLSGADNCGSTVEFTVMSVEDSEFASSFCTGDNLSRTRTYTVVDDCGNETQCVQTFTYDPDTEAPEVTCPADVTGLTCGDELPPAETVLPGIDNCSPNVEYLVSSVVDSEMPTSFCAGENLVVTRTYTVSDECRNTVECVQTFTFEADTEGPVLDCPADVTGLVCGDELPTAETMLSGTDNCSSATEFMVIAVEDGDLPTNFCTDEDLIVTRTYTVVDECGNETQCVQTFTFDSGSIPPTITCPDDCPTVVCPSDIRPSTPEFETSCGAGATVTLTGPVIEGEPGYDGTTYTYTHTVTDECGETASCHQVFTIVNGCKTIDFDFDDHGNPLEPSTEVFDQYEDFTVTTDGHLCTQLFDTGNPTSGDYDIGTPNEQYGGPGLGAGGTNNTEFQGNALIVSKDCGVPNETEGPLVFTFHCGVTIQSLDLLDMKCDHGEVLLYDQDGDLIEEIPIPGYGINSFNEFEVNVSGVYTMVVNLECGGAITAFSYCKDNEPGAECDVAPECEDYTLDFDEHGYDWEDNATSGVYDVDDQTYTISIADEDGILVDTYEENGGLVVGIDPHDIHDEVVICYNLSQVSDNVSFDIIDLDYKYYANTSQQQEAVCVYGLLGDDPTQIIPMVSSLDGSVEIDGNCGYATENSSQSGDDESILVEFTECIDKVVIIYGTGPDSPTQDPTYSKIIIGENIAFNSQVCPGACLPDCADGSGSGGDEDGDGVCDDLDVCPGGDDLADRDGDGIPDACDDICYDYHIDHSGCGANWHDNDTSGSTELGSEIVDINIIDEDNIFVDSEAVGTGLQVGIDPHNIEDELIIEYDLSLSSSNVVFDIVDLDFKNSGSKQQEAICVYGLLGSNPTPILPTVTSLDGSVEIDGNCGYATENSAHSHDDESILVEFTECIDKIVIVYGSGPDVPTHNPTYSKIIIGGGIFTVEQCPCTGCGGSDEPCVADGSGDGDSDGDGVCDDVDICPGFDDNADADGDGIPDGCDDGSREDETVNANISLYPNPAYGGSSVTLEIDTEARGDAQIVILDALGRVIEVQNIELMNNITLYELSTTRLASAVYFVQLQTNQWRTNAMKLVVVKP